MARDRTSRAEPGKAGWGLRQVSAAHRIGTTFQGKYSNSIKAAYPYPSSNFLDDLTWAAAWMYRKTGEQQFLDVRTLGIPKA